MVIAIDGPAGSGKSTVARALARRLGFTYLDSGAMYRCVALAALRRDPERSIVAGGDGGDAVGGDGTGGGGTGGDGTGGDGTGGDGTGGGGTGGGGTGGDPSPLGELAAGLDIVLGERILLDGRDVTDAIRAPEISEAASRVAADPDVRQAMVALQRASIADGDWVAEGRDIGTVVAPGAECKIFLIADPHERARRRALQLGADPNTVLAEQAIRDERDATRTHSPLTPAPGAVVLDTGGLTVEEVVERIVGLLA